jgi:ferredoxin-NADP reductase
MDFTLTLQEKKAETADVTSFIFSSDKPMEFIPGQYTKVEVVHDNPDDRGTTRYFSISAAPSEGHIQITTRLSERSSTFKTALNALPVGAQIPARAPSGSFVYTDTTRPAIFIAGGIGVTPFRSIIKEFDIQNTEMPITLIYASRTPDIAFKDLFDDIAQRHSSFKVIYVIDQPAEGWTGEVGYITAELIKKYVPDIQIPLFYASGPKPMVEGLEKTLEEMGIDQNNIKHDYFPGYDTI